MSKFMPRNEGWADRALRIVLGVGVLGLLFVGPVPGWGLVGLVGALPLLTGILGTCPAYTLLGVSTCRMTTTEA